MDDATEKETKTNIQAREDSQSNDMNIQYVQQEGAKWPFIKDVLIVLHMGFGFMTFLAAYLSFLNMISQIYQQQHFEYLGNVSIFCVYGAFGISSLFSSHFAKLINYKYVMAICSFVTCLNVFTGFLVSECQDHDYFYCSTGGVYALVIFFSSVCGGFDATLWIAQGGYQDIIIKRNPGKDGLFYGIFWGITQVSQLLSMVLAMVILKFFSQSTYFLLLTVIMSFSSIIFLLLPDLQKEENKTEKIQENYEEIENSSSQNENIQKKQKNTEKAPGLRKVVRNLKIMAEIPESKLYFVFFAFGGFVSSFISGVMHIIIERSLPSNLTSREVNIKTTYVYMSLGICSSLTGILSGVLNDKMVFGQFRFSVVLVQITFIIALLIYIYESYLACFFIGGLAGICDCLFINLSSIACTRDFNGRLEMFSYYKFFQGIAVAGSLGVNIALLKQPLYYYIGIILFLSIFALVCTWMMKKPQKDVGLLKKNNNQSFCMADSIVGVYQLQEETQQ